MLVFFADDLSLIFPRVLPPFLIFSAEPPLPYLFKRIVVFPFFSTEDKGRHFLSRYITSFRSSLPPFLGEITLLFFFPNPIPEVYLLIRL